MAYDYLRYRMGVLPEQLDRARLRFIHLLREADRLGMGFAIDEADRNFLKETRHGNGSGRTKAK